MVVLIAVVLFGSGSNPRSPGALLLWKKSVRNADLLPVSNSSCSHDLLCPHLGFVLFDRH